MGNDLNPISMMSMPACFVFVRYFSVSCLLKFQLL